MAITNHERIGKVLDLLRQGIGPFAEREFQNVYKDQSQAKAAQMMGEVRFWPFSERQKDLVFPKEVKIGGDKRLLVGKGVSTKEEFLEMVGMVDREMKGKRIF